MLQTSDNTFSYIFNATNLSKILENEYNTCKYILSHPNYAARFPYCYLVKLSSHLNLTHSEIVDLFDNYYKSKDKIKTDIKFRK